MISQEPFHPSKSLLIRGNFSPDIRSRLISVCCKILGALLIVTLLISLVMYGLMVHYEMTVNKIGRDTRILNEENKELQVKLNRIQSYQNVESASHQVGYLQKPQEALILPSVKAVRFPALQTQDPVYPPISGY